MAGIAKRLVLAYVCVLDSNLKCLTGREWKIVKYIYKYCYFECSKMFFFSYKMQSGGWYLFYNCSTFKFVNQKSYRDFFIFMLIPADDELPYWPPSSLVKFD
jgi:hypothetical protein